MNDPAGEMIDARAAADILGVSTFTVRRWARQDRIPCYRVGGGPKPRMRFKRGEIEDHIRREGD